MELEKEIQFLHEKIDGLINQSKDLVTYFGIEEILKKSIDRMEKNGQPYLSLESLSKSFISKSWKYAFCYDTRILLDSEIAEFCDRLQYFSQIPINASEKDIVDFLENKNFSKIRDFFPDVIIGFLEAAEEAFSVPEYEINEKAIFKNNRKKHTKEITNGYVYGNYSVESLQESIHYVEDKIKELTKGVQNAYNITPDGLIINSEILLMAKKIILKLVDDCNGKSGFDKGANLIYNEIIPLIDSEIINLKPKEVENLKIEIIRLIKPFSSRIPDGYSFQIEINKENINCLVNES